MKLLAPPPPRVTRVSTEPGDAGYTAWRAVQAQGRPTRVFVDGAQAFHCLMADETLGCAKVHDDAEGHNFTPYWPTKFLYGEVRIIIEGLQQ